jgi:hypothetical protein
MVPLNSSDFEASMTDSNLRAVRVLAFALAVSPIIYIGVGLMSAWDAPVPAQGPGPIFMGVLGILGLAQVLFATWFADRGISKRDLTSVFEQGLRLPKSGGIITDRGEIVAALLRGHSLMRMALIEAIAIYGLMLCFMAQGLLRQEPIWLLTLAPCVLATAILLITFPTKDRLLVVFRRTLEGRP